MRAFEFLSARGFESGESSQVSEHESRSKWMSHRVDFAKERRFQGRALNDAVRELAALMQPLVHEEGMDLQARLDEASARRAEEQRQLAERLQESVAPLFIADSTGRPDRIGSCVLVRLGADFFAFTAAHVTRDAGSAMLLAPSDGKGGSCCRCRRAPLI